MNTPILIPAFRPGPQLTDLVEQLAQAPVPAIVIVDNGNGPESQAIFERCAAFPKVRILRRDTNVGKGAGLKTGVAYILDAFPDCAGAVAADADGQHHPDDIVRVARTLEQNPDCLVLGCRQFDRDVPARSRFGNICTRALSRAILGLRIQDSQTGLRGVPSKLLPYLASLPSNGYEFELEMLIASKHRGIGIAEERIQTIYEPGNRTSHFNPLRDSMRIYFVLFRFSLLALLTTALDIFAFVLAFQATASVLVSQVISRAVALLLNYPAARKAVFLSHERHRVLLLKQILLAVVSGAGSYGLILLLTRLFAIDLILAKLSAESLLFFANFVLQRDFVFNSRPGTAPAPGNRAPVTERLVRQHTARLVLAALRRFPHYAEGGVIIELGGANRTAVCKHFESLQPGGYATLSFPTPTPLRSAARRVTKSFGLGNPLDARPLSRQEVLEAVAPLGEVVLEKTIWPLVYSRHLVVVRKRDLPQGAAVSA